MSPLVVIFNSTDTNHTIMSRAANVNNIVSDSPFKLIVANRKPPVGGYLRLPCFDSTVQAYHSYACSIRRMIDALSSFTTKDHSSRVSVSVPSTKHHLYWPRRAYTTPIAKAFRELPCLVIPLDKEVHNLLHRLQVPPTMPTTEQMKAAIDRHTTHECSCNSRDQGSFVVVRGSKAS